MRTTLDKIGAFIGEHHVLTLATSMENIPQCSNLFYTYMPQENCFIVASDKTTEHMTNVQQNPSVAVSIVLETKTVGKIQGLQLKGTMNESHSDIERDAYFKAFAYARLMNPTLWRITPLSMKLTDNRLGFGKKLHWEAG